MVFNKKNSTLPINKIQYVEIDVNGEVWIGTFDGIANYDGINWGIKRSWGDCCLAIDKNGNKCFGFYDGGLEVVEGNNTSFYNTEKRDIPSDKIITVAYDDNGMIWAGSYGGELVSFDGVTWNFHDYITNNHFINSIWDLAIDENGMKWLATDDGLASFDGTNWLFYTPENSDLPDIPVIAVLIDNNNTIWAGTSSGKFTSIKLK
jgi:ligand-binding sensor domain-containing protein